MNDLEVHDRADAILVVVDASTRVLVGSEDSRPSPVRPVHLVLEGPSHNLVSLQGFIESTF